MEFVGFEDFIELIEGGGFEIEQTKRQLSVVGNLAVIFAALNAGNVQRRSCFLADD